MHKLHKARCELKNRSAKNKNRIPSSCLLPVFQKLQKNYKVKHITIVKIGLSEETSFLDLLCGRVRKKNFRSKIRTSLTKVMFKSRKKFRVLCDPFTLHCK